MKILSLDHLVLIVKDIDVAIEFYTTVMGMRCSIFGDNRKALFFGSQKINLHEVTKEFQPKALNPTPGSADLCFLTAMPLTEVISNLQSKKVEIVEGPIEKIGALGPILSIYIRDPDQNLIKISNQR